MEVKTAPARILIVGPMPPPPSGTTTLLEYLVDILQSDPSVELHVVNTLGVRGKGLRGAMRFLRMIRSIHGFARRSDIVTLHCSTTGLHVMGPAMYLIARMTGKPLIVRKFAGDDVQTTLRGAGRWLAEYVLRHTDLYLAESKLLVDAARARGISRVEWYPNSRPIPAAAEEPDPDEGSCSRYVYIGRVNESKGMQVLAEASSRLPEGISIDVYGPWADDFPRNVFDGCPKIKYHGALQPEEIVPTFRMYDASLLPTHYRGEGYPGAILESFLAGLPVIVTRWRAIPEIVDENVGLFVEPKDAAGLADAMIRLHDDPAHFRRLRSNTRAQAEYFAADRWAGYFLDRCRALAVGSESRLR
ncbi:MAG: glycosyltransferase family 4 protein [Candidatus Hydrogenedentes bacterium]|nr:glycosyltransferase family 4 protein [Candidatus Hydrogenedentota bacterium]